MDIQFRKIAKVSLFLVYLVIIAGAVVRMTGSGMGCPDWPKCFGYYIPPTNESELKWQPDRLFEKGQVIIKDESLQISKETFTTKSDFNSDNWELYTKHDYAIFNPWHTWIEYINRLFGALAGLATLLLAIASIKFWKKKKRIPILAWLVVFGMVFQAWLGATVVYSVLEPAKITVHMLMALVIVAMLLYIIYLANAENKLIRFDNLTLNLSILAIGLTLIQIVMGTQVRQFVDEQIDIYGYDAKSNWLKDPLLLFYIHRSFSILVLLLNAFLAFRITKLNLGHIKIYWVLFILLVEVFTGIAMNYLNFPFASQPLHLVLASILFGVQFYIVLDALKPRKISKTS
ncbi:COX15/CtaA family protein [Maribacter arcticus]|jgi:cytochrome c oxidase assembly protein subunit 15|uniref:Cytochrome c oxidase assembly protein subunit 15 n=1 Tax=Maribacter arcticus TaxID=561365 RepID=A0A1T4ZXV7_9FLAO|nr:COX15/CtaA family protein [Maribacter arcticus]SKB27367.1 cytochrome c oxidase assembly protein subunit 15 [Maribacter arcticus]|tara:strand:+ start:1416 stop:2450 length:1035 start_codon:yes stop_codon:yes gene_type:complete